MSTWGQILSEVEPNKDNLLLKYIGRLAKYRQRNVVVYFSSWLTPHDGGKYDINDADATGLMNAFCHLDKKKGLDLILHTPGGSPTAAEGISKYMHNKFGNDIDVFVPHMCMSAGTLLACSASKIYMGKESCLGPVDPQFNGIPAFDIRKEIDDAKNELKADPKTENYWRIQLGKYPAAFYYMVDDAIKLSSVLLKQWLDTYMFFSDSPEEKKKIDAIISKLNNNSFAHARHFDINDCINMGLKISKLEDDQKLQDFVLSIYHACTIIAGSNTSKIITNNLGGSYVVR